MKLDGASILREFSRINEQYHASMARGNTEAYIEGAQIGRLKLSIELCPHPEGTPERTDWTRGYFMEIGKCASTGR